jgi:hypothetical protein
MRVYLVALVSIGALIIGWAIGWSLGILILIAACLSLGFGLVFWWAWDALKIWREKRAFLSPAGETGYEITPEG